MTRNNNKFNGDPDYDTDPGIFKGIIPLRDSGNYTNFADNSRSC